MMLQARHITKTYGRETVLKDLSLDLNEHETLSVLGPSGCGKTTLLKILAGLESLDHGTIQLQGREISDIEDQKRNIVYLYQEALLFPHLNVFGNVAFGLRVRKVGDSEIERQVNRMLHQLELDDTADKMPHQLSGGQKQRVAFGRALIINPDVLLLDEPFGNLDTDTRTSMQQLFKNVAHQFGITALFVTHNIKEAILMGDRIAHLRQGNLKVYPTLQAFVDAPETGVKDEMEFWEKLPDRNHKELE